MSATTIWAVQDALKTILDADATLVAELVTPVPIGWPMGDLTFEHVWIVGGVDPTEQQAVITTSANPRRHERYTLLVRVFVRHSVDTFVEVRDRAKTLANAVELAVQGDHTVGGTAFFAQVAGHELNEGLDRDAREAMVTLRISISAYING
jgi:hypothetical protein